VPMKPAACKAEAVVEASSIRAAIRF